MQENWLLFHADLALHMASVVSLIMASKLLVEYYTIWDMMASSTLPATMTKIESFHKQQRRQGTVCRLQQVHRLDVNHIHIADDGSGICAFFTVQLSWGHTGWALEKRFSDFVRLHAEMKKQLSVRCNHKHIPVLPRKSLVRRFDRPFLEKRCHELNVYLRQIASDPILSQHVAVRRFCGLD
jgi:hypothetical protein